MDVTTKALVLRATDYKESDKLILLYSLEYGKITVHAKGIRKGNAKLKFAADQFCFGQYELSKIDDRFTLKTCEQMESFFSLREDVFAYYAACTVAESVMEFTEEGQSEPQVFVEALRALTCLTDGTEPTLVALRFLLGFLRLEGYPLQLSNCIVCGAESEKLFLDRQCGGLVCDSCRSADCTRVTLRTLAACKMVQDMPYDKLKNIDFTQELLKDALRFCSKYISFNHYPLKSLSELLAL